MRQAPGVSDRENREVVPEEGAHVVRVRCSDRVATTAYTNRYASIDSACTRGGSTETASGARQLLINDLDRASLQQASDPGVLRVAAPDLCKRYRWDRGHEAAFVADREDLADALLAALVGDQCASIESQAGHSART